MLTLGLYNFLMYQLLLIISELNQPLLFYTTATNHESLIIEVSYTDLNSPFNIDPCSINLSSHASTRKGLYNKRNNKRAKVQIPNGTNILEVGF